MNAAALDAVTIDAYGTLVTLDRPLERLRDALRERGLEHGEDEVAAAFRAELEYYREHKLEGRDEATLADLRARCAGVFVGELGRSGLEFTDGFMGALVFEPLPDVRATLERLRAHGLALAVVSDWDVGLHEQLERAGLARFFDAVVTAAETGAPKPDPTGFLAALGRLGVRPERGLHVGDDRADEAGAAAAGMRFAPAPLTGALT